MASVSRKIGLVVIAVGLACGAVVLVEIAGGHGKSSSLATPNVQLSMPPQTVHTADWYVAHPDILKVDDARCGGDAASIPQAACQNAATADQRLLAAQMQQAASANASAGRSTTPKTP